MKPVAVEYLDPDRSGQLDESGVERHPRGHRRVPARGGQRHDDLAARRRAEVGGVDVVPPVDRVRVEPERIELAQGEGGEAVTAALVPREASLVDHDDRSPRTVQRDGRSDPCGAGADDEDVALANGRSGLDRHGSEATGRHAQPETVHNAAPVTSRQPGGIVMSRLCEGRIAIVTGAGRGIGREHALSLAHHGAKVVVNDLGGNVDGTGGDLTPAEQVVEEIKAAGGEAIANGENVADFEGAGRMVQAAIDAFGDLHVVVNNAGILRDRMLSNMTEAEWDAVINVHLKGTFAPSRHAVAYWRDRAKAGEPVSGRIINTTSVSGIYGNPGQTNYGAAKAGIAAFTTSSRSRWRGTA
jgi:NAD(P)-dependent dehydrogenase (short-subunit alcohol dehydrogenase family)